jgi:hypothetical protein
MITTDVTTVAAAAVAATGNLTNRRLLIERLPVTASSFN